jgi:hypothetical protein
MASTVNSNRISSIQLLPFLAIVGQLALFLVVIYLYDLESRAFLHLGIEVFIAFIVHYFLPQPLRRPFFAAVSMFCLATVFGFQLERWSLAGLTQAAWIIGLGLGVIGLCHLPVAFSIRVTLLVLAAIVLISMRGGFVPAPWSAVIWPVFGSMFMFRAPVYMHALQHEKPRPSLLDAICYFFMLPNPCFPLFPVVDFQTFRRTYYDLADRHQIYQTGVTWLYRGATHLLLYRIVYHYFVVSATDVSNIPELVQYLLWPFLLYLRISGQFHVIVGMLHLFGFNLPETHRLYYLSSSFTDFWRRINIYWKDFMMKLFFYPSYVRIKRWNPTAALILSMAIVFAATWLLHGYQWFWIRGSWLLTWNDTLFWTILASIVIINGLFENAYGRRRSLGGGPTPWREAVLTGIKTALVFCTICVLWSFWSTESIGEWLTAFHAAYQSPSPQWLRGGLMLVGIFAAIAIPATLLATNRWTQPFHLWRSASTTAIALIALALLAVPSLQNVWPYDIRQVLATIQKSDINRRDFAVLERGYYENLLDVGRFNPELVEVYRTRPDDWVFALEGEHFNKLDHPPYFELKPHFEEKALGVMVRTNSYGMRDKEYSKQPEDGTLRIAVIGPSFVMGVGVENDQTFESIVEGKLNSEAKDFPSRYEVLNFGVAGYTQIQSLGAIQHKVLEFSPHCVLYFEHGDPFLPTLNGVSNYFRSGNFKHFDFLVEIGKRAGIEESEDFVTIKRQLNPFREEALAGIYRGIVSACKSRNIPAVWVYLPRPEEWDRGPSELELRLAQEAGFETVVLKDVYGKTDLKSLWLARWDHHPNAEGHRLIADGLYNAIKSSPWFPSIIEQVRDGGQRTSTSSSKENN